MKNRFVLKSLVLAATFAAASPALAAAITLYAGSPGATADAGNTTTGAPGFGTQSFFQIGDTKGEVYVTALALFGHDVSFSSIASVSYWTNKPTPGAGDGTGVDWSFYIYTVKQLGDANFYHTRLTSEPLYTNPNAANDPANVWHQWTSNGPAPMMFYDANRNAGVQGTSMDPTLATLQAGPYTWPVSGTMVDYNSELINFFSLQTGSAWSAGFKGLVDGLTVTLKNGEVGTVNLEASPRVAAVPEPGSMALFGIGIAGFAIGARRTLRKRIG